MLKGCLITIIYLIITTSLSAICFYYGTKGLKISNIQLMLITAGAYLLQPFYECLIGFVKGLLK